MEKNVITKKSGLSTAGLVLGIIGISISFIPILNNASFILGILAIVFGVIALFKKASKGKTIVAIILGVLSLIITISLQNSWANSLDDLTGNNTDEILKNVDINIGNFQVFTDEYGFKETKLVVKITNKLSDKKSFDFTIEAISTDGTRIDTDYIYVTNLGPNQSQNFEIFTFVSDNDIDNFKNATFNVVEASMY